MASLCQKQYYSAGLCILLAISIVETKGANLAPALIIFGDSIVDVGVNTYLWTTAKADFLPYGRDFAKGPTGRFSNGRVLSDFIASWLELPYPLPYNDPAAEGNAILQGINFASSSSGYLDDTSKSINIAPLRQQLQWFKHYQQKLVELIGPANASYITSNSMFVLCTGSNDYTRNYYLNSSLQRMCTKGQFQDLLIQSYEHAVQELYDSGARKLAVCSIPAIGCLPAQITMYGKGSLACINRLNQDAEAMNTRLKHSTKDLKTSLKGLKITYLDIYSTALDASKHPGNYGFSVGPTGCCGTGRFEASILCNPFTPACPIAGTYVYWDAYHPTDSMNAIIWESIFPQLMAFMKLN